MFFRIFICFILLNSFNLYSQDFKTVSRGLAFLEFPKGENGLAAITESDGKIYVVTTQSLFLKYGSKFVFKDYKGTRLESTGMSVSTDEDLVRFEINSNDYIKPLSFGEDSSSIYQINPDNGTVYMKESFSEEINQPGGVVVSEEGLLTGFGSLTNGYDGKVAKLILITKETKWANSTIRTFGTQIDELREMKAKMISMEGLKRVNRMNAYIENKPNYHESHVPWVKDRNIQYEVAVFNSKGGKSMGAAKFRHESRCSHYSGMKRLSIFASNIIKIDKMTKWQSNFFKELSSSLSIRADKVNSGLKKSMSLLLKSYPATKTRL